MDDDRISTVDMEGLTEEEKEQILEDAVNQRKNAKERLYDKVPLTYKQVDILTKILVGIFGVMMLYFIFTSKIWG